MGLALSAQWKSSNQLNFTATCILKIAVLKICWHQLLLSTSLGNPSDNVKFSQEDSMLGFDKCRKASLLHYTFLSYSFPHSIPLYFPKGKIFSYYVQNRSITQIHKLSAQASPSRKVLTEEALMTKIQLPHTTRPEEVLSPLPEKAVVLPQLHDYAWAQVKKTNQFLSNFQSNRFLLQRDNNMIMTRQLDELMAISQLQR